MKNIIFSEYKSLIEKAQLKSILHFNQQFREWLKRYASQTEIETEYEGIMSRLSYAESDGPFRRDELNVR